MDNIRAIEIKFVTIITLCHGLNLGWLSPMLAKLQSPFETPLNFVVNVEEASWIGSMLSVGALTGNIVFGFLVGRIGRKTCIYLLAFPNMCLWLMLYFANSVEFLYIARFFGGVTGGGVYVVIPIFISEIADSSIRGRLAAFFSLSLSSGILMGFIISSHLAYHLIPCMVFILPVLYLVTSALYAETPQHLLRNGCDEEALKAFKFYKNFKSSSKDDLIKLNADFEELRKAVTQKKTKNPDVGCNDFCTKPARHAFTAGAVLMGLTVFSGHFAFTNYMSSIFAATNSEIHPDTNTIIIGVVQLIGNYTATNLVDRYGRKILLIVSSGGMGVGLAILGMYSHVAEETEADMSSFSLWLPLALTAFIIFICNVGVNSVLFVVLVEIMPVRIRSFAVPLCFSLLSIMAFILLKVFPVFMSIFGLSATMWFCATVCGLGLFYISIFLPETKGKSMDNDDTVE